MVGMLRQRRVVDLRNLGMPVQKIDHFERIAHMTLHTQRQCLKPLQEHKHIERRDSRTRITQQHRTYACHKCRRPGDIGKHSPMIARIRSGKSRILPCFGFPVKPSSVHYHTSKARTVPSDEFCSRMYHDVRTMLYRAYQIRRAERIVNNQRHSVAVGDIRHPIYIKHLAVWIAERLCINGLGARSNGPFKCIDVVDIYDCISDTLRSQRVGNQVIRASIQIVGSNNMVARSKDILQRICRRSSP